MCNFFSDKPSSLHMWSSSERYLVVVLWWKQCLSYWQSGKKKLKKLLCCCPQGACCLRTCTLLKSPDIMITRRWQNFIFVCEVWTKRMVRWNFLLPILWCDSCWQLSTRRRISHIWLYRSEKKVIFLKNHTIYWWLVLCLLGANFLATWLGKVGRYKRYKGVFFFGEKMSPSHHIMTKII